VVRPMVRKMTRPEIDPAAIAAAAIAAATAEAAAAEKLKAERIAAAEAEVAARLAQEKADKEAAEAAAALAAAEAAKAEAEQSADKADEIEIQEGESLEEIKARMSSLKPKKPTISADMLNTANTYDDKVALLRMIVSEDAARARVAGVLKNMIQLS
jgi:hypothetical protein